MNKIWKYTFEGGAAQTFEMPEGATILSVQTQHDEVCLWAMVDPDSRRETRTFELIGTGNPVTNIPKGMRRTYRGTAQVGGFVWHVFEIRRKAYHIAIDTPGS